MDDNDLDVLYSNPMIMPAVLEQTFTNELGLTPKMHSRASRYAASNKILQDKLIDETFDEFVDNYQVSEARQALWALVLKAPPTEDWALVLGDAAQVIFEPGLPKEFQPDPSTSQEKLETGRAWRDRREAYRLLVIDAAEKRWLGPEDKRSEPYNIWRNARAAFAEAVCRAHSDKNTNRSQSP